MTDQIEKGTYWFHRNQLKFTALQDFTCDHVCHGELARKLLNDLKGARFELLNHIYELKSTREEIVQKFDAYVSLLLGICKVQTSVKEGDDNDVEKESEASESKSQIGKTTDHLKETIKGKKEIKLQIPARFYFGFRWTDSLQKYSKTPKHSIDRVDAYFDLISVTSITAIYLTKLANNLSCREDIDMNTAKEVHSCLKLAASMFLHVKNEMVSELDQSVCLVKKSWSDLDPRILETYSIQCQAELLEVTIARAIKLNHKPHLIASLSQDCQKLFKSALDRLESTEDDDEKMVEKWQFYLNLKQQIYSALAYGYYGEGIKQDDKMSGYATAYLKSAISILNIAGKKTAKDYVKTAGAGALCKPNKHPFFFKVKEDMQKMYDSCDKDRQMVYGMPLPADGALPDPTYKNDVTKLYSIDTYNLPEKSNVWTKDVYSQLYYGKAVKTDIGTQLMTGLSLQKKEKTGESDVLAGFKNDKSKLKGQIKVYDETDIKITQNVECSLM